MLDKPAPVLRGKKKTEVSLVCASAAEHLTFVAASSSGGVEAVYADENVWLSQKMMRQIYDVETPHLQLPSQEGLHGRQIAGGFSCSKFSNNCRRRQNLRHPALQPFRHYSLRLTED